MNADNFFKNLFNKPKTKEEEHDITIEEHQSEFNERLEPDEKIETMPEADINKERE